MARILRPGVFMSAYLALYLVAGPWPDTAIPSTAQGLGHDVSLPGIAIAAWLSWRVTRGSWFARGLILAWTILGFAGAFTSPALQSGSLVPCWLLAGYVGQLALVLSAPVYERTRKFPLVGEPGRAGFWPVPPRWTVTAAAVLAVVCALLGLGSMDLRSVPRCSSASCMTLGQGYPVHFLAAAQAVSLDHGVRSFFADLADAAYNASALTEDLALWFLAAFALIYTLWIPSRRPEESPALTSLAVPDSRVG